MAVVPAHLAVLLVEVVVGALGLIAGTEHPAGSLRVRVSGLYTRSRALFAANIQSAGPDVVSWVAAVHEPSLSGYRGIPTP